MRVGIVGCGVISKVYAERLRTLDGVEVTACADLRREAAERRAERSGIPRVMTPAELLAAPDIDTVLNLTVPLAHDEVNRAALEAGKHVYVEKPLAVEREAASATLALADARGLRVGCAPDTFLGAGLQTSRYLIDTGAIGQPLAANAFFLSPGPEGWHPTPHFFYRRGGGPLLDMGPYYYTALISLLGPVSQVTGIGRALRKERTIGSEPHRGETIPVEVPTHVSATLQHESGAVSTVVTSFDVHATRYRFIEIYGSDGALRVPDPNFFGGPVKLWRAGGTTWEDVPHTHRFGDEDGGNHRGLGLADMAAAIRENRPHRASGALAYHALDAMSSALQASDEERHVTLASRCERPAPMPAAA